MNQKELVVFRDKKKLIFEKLKENQALEYKLTLSAALINIITSSSDNLSPWNKISIIEDISLQIPE